MTLNIAVVYYSSTGTIYRMAQQLADSCREMGASVRLRRVAELAPREVIASKPAWEQHLRTTRYIAEASEEDILWADGVLFGSPTRFGNVSSQLKQFIDTLGGPWMSGQLADKAYGAFTSGESLHGGMETTLVTMNNMFFHFGGVIVPPAVQDRELASGANPYGTCHVRNHPSGVVSADTLARAQRQAARLVTVAHALKYATGIEEDALHELTRSA